MSTDRHAHAEEALGPTGAGRIRLDSVDSARASRRWWDADAADYHREHGDFLGVDSPGGEFVWCPEALHEGDVHLLGDVVGKRILEVGCGSAPCSRWLAGQGAHPIGLDLSMGMLRRGVAAMDRGGPRVPLVQADAESLPFADAAFDAACSAFGAVPFVADSARVMREVARVLRPDGRLYLLDFGPPANRLAALLARGVRHVEETADHLDGALLDLLQAAGFAEITVRGRWMTTLGTLILYRAARPAA
jgi:SAM-dependent methyltransferase